MALLYKEFTTPVYIKFYPVSQSLTIVAQHATIFYTFRWYLYLLDKFLDDIVVTKDFPFIARAMF